VCTEARPTSLQLNRIKPIRYSVSSAQLPDLFHFGCSLHACMCECHVLAASSERLISAKSSLVIIFVSASSWSSCNPSRFVLMSREWLQNSDFRNFYKLPLLKTYYCKSLFSSCRIDMRSGRFMRSVWVFIPF
jgi:hypothetical protein